MFKALKYSAIVFIILLSVTQTSFAKTPAPTPTPAPVLTETPTFTSNYPNFSDKIDFSYTYWQGNGLVTNNFYEISDQNGSSSSPVFEYTHTLPGLNSTTYNLLTATLSLTHLDNSNTAGEVWFSDSHGNMLIGQLSASNGANPYTDSWTLSQTILNEINSPDPWSLTVDLFETTSGTDKIKIYSSLLSGTYSTLPTPTPDPTPGGNNNLIPVPEPSTLLLLGAALLGVGLARKRIKR